MVGAAGRVNDRRTSFPLSCPHSNVDETEERILKTETVNVPRQIAAHATIKRHRTAKLVKLTVATEMEIRSVDGEQAPFVARIEGRIGRMNDPEYRFFDGSYYRAVSYSDVPVDRAWLATSAHKAADILLPKEFDRIDPGYAERHHGDFHSTIKASDPSIVGYEPVSRSGEDMLPDDLLLVEGRLYVACGEPCLVHGSSMEATEFDPFLSDAHSVVLPLDLLASTALADAVLADDPYKVREEVGKRLVVGEGHVFSDLARLNMPMVWCVLLQAVDGVPLDSIAEVAEILERTTEYMGECRRAVSGETSAAAVLETLPAILDDLETIGGNSRIRTLRRLCDLSAEAATFGMGAEREDPSLYSMGL
jgi:hypothetical protein